MTRWNPNFGKKTPKTEEDIFDTATNPVIIPEVKGEEMVSVPSAMLADLLASYNAKKEQENGTNLLDDEQKKMKVGVAFLEKEGKEYAVTGFLTKFLRDGSPYKTWTKWLDEITKKEIIWIQPILVDLETQEVSDQDVIRYDEFLATIRILQLEVADVKINKIDMTPASERGNTIDEVNYEIKGKYGFAQPVATGKKRAVKVTGVERVFTINYEKNVYTVSEEVCNLKS